MSADPRPPADPVVSPADTIRQAEEWVGEFRDTWDWPRDPSTREVVAAAAWTTLDEAATLVEEMAAFAAALLAVGERDRRQIARLTAGLREIIEVGDGGQVDLSKESYALAYEIAAAVLAGEEDARP